MIKKNDIVVLEILAIQGRNLPNKDFFKKQDPFLTFHIGEQVHRTKVDKNGGTRPEWNNRLRFERLRDPVETIMKIKCFDDEWKRKEQFIGECAVDLGPVYKTGECDGWFKLYDRGNPAGEVYLELTFYTQNGIAKKYAQGVETLAMVPEVKTSPPSKPITGPQPINSPGNTVKANNIDSLNNQKTTLDDKNQTEVVDLEKVQPVNVVQTPSNIQDMSTPDIPNVNAISSVKVDETHSGQEEKIDNEKSSNSKPEGVVINQSSTVEGLTQSLQSININDQASSPNTSEDSNQHPNKIVSGITGNIGEIAAPLKANDFTPPSDNTGSIKNESKNHLNPSQPSEGNMINQYHNQAVDHHQQKLEEAKQTDVQIVNEPYIPAHISANVAAGIANAAASNAHFNQNEVTTTPSDIPQSSFQAQLKAQLEARKNKQNLQHVTNQDNVSTHPHLVENEVPSNDRINSSINNTENQISSPQVSQMYPINISPTTQVNHVTQAQNNPIYNPLQIHQNTHDIQLNSQKVNQEQFSQDHHAKLISNNAIVAETHSITSQEQNPALNENHAPSTVTSPQNQVYQNIVPVGQQVHTQNTVYNTDNSTSINQPSSSSHQAQTSAENIVTNQLQPSMDQQIQAIPDSLVQSTHISQTPLTHPINQNVTNNQSYPILSTAKPQQQAHIQAHVVSQTQDIVTQAQNVTSNQGHSILPTVEPHQQIYTQAHNVSPQTQNITSNQSQPISSTAVSQQQVHVQTHNIPPQPQSSISGSQNSSLYQNQVNQSSPPIDHYSQQNQGQVPYKPVQHQNSINNNELNYNQNTNIPHSLQISTNTTQVYANNSQSQPHLSSHPTTSVTQVNIHGQAQTVSQLNHSITGKPNMDSPIGSPYYTTPYYNSSSYQSPVYNNNETLTGGGVYNTGPIYPPAINYTEVQQQPLGFVFNQVYHPPPAMAYPPNKYSTNNTFAPQPSVSVSNYIPNSNTNTNNYTPNTNSYNNYNHNSNSYSSSHSHNNNSYNSNSYNSNSYNNNYNSNYNISTSSIVPPPLPNKPLDMPSNYTSNLPPPLPSRIQSQPPIQPNFEGFSFPQPNVPTNSNNTYQQPIPVVNNNNYKPFPAPEEKKKKKKNPFKFLDF